MASSIILAVPLEIRLQIYSYILPKIHLPINLCPSRSASNPVYGTSIVASLVRQRIEFAQIVRQNGLQLLFVCRSIRNEIFPCLRSLIGRFHCEKCYAYFLTKLKQGSRIETTWLRSVEIEVRIDKMKDFARTESIISLIKHQALDAKERLRKLTWNCYGRLDLMEKEKWTMQDMRPKRAISEDPGPEHEFLIEPMLHSKEERGDFWLICGFFSLGGTEPLL